MKLKEVRDLIQPVDFVLIKETNKIQSVDRFPSFSPCNYDFYEVVAIRPFSPTCLQIHIREVD